MNAAPAVPATAVEIHALRIAISPERLGTYVRRAHGNMRRALDLYAWNCRAGAALLPVLHANEVTLRNAVHRALTAQFGAEWPYSGGFRRALPRSNQRDFLRDVSSMERKLRRSPVAAADIVAAQNYWFWVNLLTSRFEARIWAREFRTAFPAASLHVTRDVVHARADALRRLRNRIAHHEPLLDHDLHGAYHRALAIVRWVSPTKAQWVEQQWPAPTHLYRPS